MHASLLSMENDELHLWLLPVDDGDFADAALARMLDVLPKEERARYEQIVVVRARREHVLTRTLVRRVLSRYAPIHPLDWRFTSNEYGRPAVAAPTPPAGLDFNISHTGGMIVCMVGRHRELGVDVEDRRRARRTLDIAERFFSEREGRALRALAPARQAHRFMELWTLKEAYIKARGMGLSIPLADFSFDLAAAPETIRIGFSPRIEDDARRWRFALSSPTPRHQLAWAATLRDDESLTIVEHDARALFGDAG